MNKFLTEYKNILIQKEKDKKEKEMMSKKNDKSFSIHHDIIDLALLGYYSSREK